MTKDLLLGVQLYFAREGTDYGGVISAVDAKPSDPLNTYDKLACCEQWEPTSDKSEIRLRCPKNGVWADRRLVTTARNVTHNFSLQQWQNATLAEMLLNGSTPDANGDFVPNGAVDDVRGWLYLEAYAHDNSTTPAIVIDTWVNLNIGSHQFAESLEPHTLKADQLQSELNAGNINLSDGLNLTPPPLVTPTT